MREILYDLGQHEKWPATRHRKKWIDMGPSMKLNLGCGNMTIPGYVNCDIVKEREGIRPDVHCDVTKTLPFGDDCADEILSVHLVEHIDRWQVVHVIREWTRVLKPGGNMVMECPNLISACQVILTNPMNATGPGPEGQKSMWVLYGDPQWKDPLMTHRWAYTPQSLALVMYEAGLKDLRQEPAQFKLREPRDMRIVGTK
jgi:SAM-dependent methyltransferase